MSEPHIRAPAVAVTDDSITVSGDYPGCPPARLFAYWTEPSLLIQWWPREAAVDPRPGGAYHLAWPSVDWHLRGVYTAIEPGALLAFTWRWDGDEESGRERHVRVIFTPEDCGTRLAVTHGTYGDSDAERETRQGHIDGWTHFLARLRALDPS